jgi:uncharacterized protein (TIGR00269 family)
VVKQVQATVSRYRLLKHGDYIGVAVSGGKDSLTLLHILHQISPPHGSELVALTVDEGIAGYRDEALRLVEAFTARLKIPLVVVSYQELYGFTLDAGLKWRRPRKVSACSICGVLRRRALDVAAERAGVDVVAKAFNLDDMAQSFLMNLLAGDLKRIRWLDPALQKAEGFRARTIKPLVEVYEEEVALYAYLNRIPFQEEDCPYRGESIRSEVRAFLNSLEARHPGIKHILFKTAIKVARNLAVEPVETGRCERCGYPSTQPVCQTCRALTLVEVNRSQ